jgi:uncharacterized membrane protein
MDKTIHTERKGVDRINSFSDAVFAVAITLLILTIDADNIAGNLNNREMLHALGDVWHRFFGFALSFVIVGAFWMSHHYLFVRIRKHNRGLMWLNHFFLMTIVFLPFPTELMSDHPDNMVATGLYAVSMAACGIMAAALWWYSTVHYDFVEGSVSLPQRKDSIYSFLAMSGVFLISLALLPLNPNAAKYFWIAIWPMEMLISRKFEKDAAAAEGPEEECAPGSSAEES